MKHAIVLCSGGLDSVVAAHYVKKKLKYDDMLLLFFDYGQRSLVQERISAKRCAKEIGANFREIQLPELKAISHSLLNRRGRVRKVKRTELKKTEKESQKWYVPCRNTLFIAYALALAESFYIQKKIISSIFTGFKCEGKEAYPDTTPQFVLTMNIVSRVACARPFKIIAPFIEFDKEEIILLGKKLHVPLHATYSCYNGKGSKHCGYCLACQLRQAAFYWANVSDPTSYALTDTS